MAASITLANGFGVLNNFFANGRRGLLKSFIPICQGHRNILSDAYRAEDAWQNRKRLEVHMDDLRVKLDQDLLTLKKPVASVDLQKFIDNIINEDELKASEQYIYSFRHTPVAHHLRPYTIHSWLRVCLDFHQPLRALRALQDKTHYGLFPDIYTFNLLLDHFLRSKDYHNAYLVAKEMMLIEVMNSSTPLAQALSLYACHHLLKQGSPQEDEKWSIGMTLADATRDNSSCLSRSYHVIGYCMTGNIKPISKILDHWLSGSSEDDKIVTQEAVDHLKEALETAVTEDAKMKIQEQFQSLESSGRIEKASLDELIETTILPVVGNLEKDGIDNYPKVLRDWHSTCVEAIKLQKEDKNQMERKAKEARLEKLLQEVGGVEYWIEKARSEGKEVQDSLMEEDIKRQ
ncbi:small ribosomal subunit protein mS27-like [Apostichopus japonicus]|uniref:small ribosomal subunit protein mS27-like n=1 Tax=Stichopus japonicus TaxID=307972 RepID=UPI003AB4A379